MNKKSAQFDVTAWLMSILQSLFGGKAKQQAGPQFPEAASPYEDTVNQLEEETPKWSPQDMSSFKRMGVNPYEMSQVPKARKFLRSLKFQDNTMKSLFDDDLSGANVSDQLSPEEVSGDDLSVYE